MVEGLLEFVAFGGECLFVGVRADVNRRRDVARTFWTVNREGSRAAGAHQTRHFDDGANAATSARAAHCAVSKSLNEACDVFAVEAARSHHDDAPIAPPVSRQENAVVP